MNPKLERFYAQFPESGPPEMYYNSETQDFLYKQTGGNASDRKWIHVGKESACALLSRAGISAARGKDGAMPPAMEYLLKLMDCPDSTVQFSGSLGGYMPGFHRIPGGTNALITEGPEIPKAIRGDCSYILQIMESMFGEGPVKYVHAWNKYSMEMLVRGITRGMPVLIFVGPRNCGKSFYQDYILTPLLGNRYTDGNPWAEGRTGGPQNKEMLSKEHLRVSDPKLSPLPAARKELASKVKEVAANNGSQYRKMFTDAVTLSTFLRVTMSLNHETEAMAGLFAMTDDISDKTMLFRTEMADWPEVCDTIESREAFKLKVISQVPAYRWWLENVFVVPYEMTRDPATKQPARFGINCWHDTSLKHRLLEVSPEYKLLELVKQAYFCDDEPVKSLSVSVTELEKALTSDDSPVRYAARSLLTHGSRVRTYLERLSKEFPDHVYRWRTEKARGWKLIDLDSLIDKVAVSGYYDSPEEEAGCKAGAKAEAKVEDKIEIKAEVVEKRPRGRPPRRKGE